MKKAILVGVVAGTAAVLAIAGYEFMAPEKRLVRACHQLVLKAAVAPSTVAFIDGETTFSSGKDITTYRDLLNVLKSAEAREKAASDLYEATKLEYRDTPYNSPIRDEIEARRDQGYKDSNAAYTARLKAKAELDAAQVDNVSEVTVSLDSQNRAGALLRATASCDYPSGASTDRQIELMSLAAFDTR